MIIGGVLPSGANFSDLTSHLKNRFRYNALDVALGIGTMVAGIYFSSTIATLIAATALSFGLPATLVAFPLAYIASTAFSGALLTGGFSIVMNGRESFMASAKSGAVLGGILGGVLGLASMLPR